MMVTTAVTRVGQLDVLRAIACILVLIAHLDSVYGMPPLPSELGPIGVAIFFALSGYLITRGLIRPAIQSATFASDVPSNRSPELQRTDAHIDGNALRKMNLSGFYLKRSTRILPPYLLLLLVLLPFWWDERLAWCATFAFNFLYVSGARDYFHVQQVNASIPPVGHMWSLCVEEHYYWGWPLVLALLGRRYAGWILGAIVLSTPFTAYWLINTLDSRGANPDVVSGILSRITLTQLTSVSIGSLIAIYEEQLVGTAWLKGRVRPVSLAGLLLLLAAWMLNWTSVQSQVLAWFDQNTQYLQILEPTRIHLWGAGIALLGMNWTFLMRLPGLQYLGRISYGLYLYHLPVYWWFDLASFGKTQTWVSAVCALVTTFAIASLSFHWLEQPCIRWGQKRAMTSESAKPRQRMGWIVCLSLLAMFGCTLVAHRHSLPIAHLVQLTPQIPLEQRRHELRPIGTATQAYRWLGVDHCYDIEGYRRTARVAARRSDVARILTIGDSYTWGACVPEHQTYTAVLERQLKQVGRNVEVINCGKPGGQAEDMVTTIDQLTSYKPDMIIYAATITDFLPSGHGWEGHQAEEWFLPENQQRFTRAVQSMQAKCDEHKIAFLAFVFFQNPSDSRLAEVARQIEQLLQAAGVHTVTIADYLREHASEDFRIYVPFDDHPNQRCHSLIAQLLAKSVVDRSAIESRAANSVRTE